MSEKLSGIWDAIGPESIAYLNKNFNDKAPEIVEFLIMYLLNEEEVEISLYDEEDGQKGSFITYDPFSEDKQLSIKNRKQGVFELELFLFDDDDEEVIFTYELDTDDLKSIPVKLQGFMENARVKKQEIAVLSSSL